MNDNKTLDSFPLSLDKTNGFSWPVFKGCNVRKMDGEKGMLLSIEKLFLGATKTHLYFVLHFLLETLSKPGGAHFKC